jgi:hypothetical protein
MKNKPKRQVIETKGYGKIIAEPWTPPAKPKTKEKLKRITPGQFEYEKNLITEHHNAGILTAQEHKDKYDALLARYKESK